MPATDLLPGTVAELEGTQYDTDKFTYKLVRHRNVTQYLADGYTERGNVKDSMPDPRSSMVCMRKIAPKPLPKIKPTPYILGDKTKAAKPKTQEVSYPSTKPVRSGFMSRIVTKSKEKKK